MNQPQFIYPKIIQRYPLLSEQMTPQRLSVILNSLETVLRAGVVGDIVELGCYIGTTSIFLRRLMDTAGNDKRQLHVYDSFQGLPAKTIQDASVAGTAFKAGELRASTHELRRNFRRNNLIQPVIHKAWFADLSQRDLPEAIAFAFLDSDFYQSITVSLQLVWPKLTAYGTIVIDDYNRPGLPGVTRAVMDFFPNEVRIRQQNNLAVITKTI